MSLFTFLIKRVLPIPKIEKQERYVFVGPHPDDIEVACAPTVAKLSAMGKEICFIIVTDGRCGTDDINLAGDKLVNIRKQESIEAAKILGVTDVRFLGFPDAGAYDVEKVADKIAVEFADFKPDLIFACDNHTKSECHPDHIKVGRATEIAMFYSKPKMISLGTESIAQPKGIAYYYAYKPNTYINVSKYFSFKKKTLEAHKSQFEAEGHEDDIKMMLVYFKILAIRYGIRKCCRYADSYRVLSSLYLHCAPDASDI